MPQRRSDTYDMDDLLADAWGRGRGGFPDMNHAGGGVESRYDPVIGREILRRVLEGDTVAEIAEDPDLPSYATIYTWVRRHAEFRWRWQAARRHLAEGRVNAIEIRERSRRALQVLKAKVDGGPVRGRGGRRSTYSLKVARVFCRRVARGETVSAICADPKMPSVKALYGWLRREPLFREMYAEARGAWLMELEGRQLAALDKVLRGPMTAARVRAANQEVERLAGRIGRLTPKTYRPGAV
jgi:transposase-like protein